MRFRQLGNSDLTVSVVGLGCNNFGRKLDLEGSRPVLNAALEAGITFFDTAESYGNGDSEKFIAESLKGHRQEVVLATKFGWAMPGDASLVPRGSRSYIREAVARNLSRLQTDYIDLYQMHRPDPTTPIEETLAAMDELVKEGKVRYIGYSNASAEQITAAETASRKLGISRFISVQNRGSLLDRSIETEVQPLCMKLGIGILPFSPLADGLLTGKYRRGEPAPEGTRLASRGLPSDDLFAQAEALAAFGRERGHSLLEVAIAGLAAQPAVGSVIAGATTPEQIKANVAAGDWELTAEELAALNAIR